jgi:hypothetical protein
MNDANVFELFQTRSLDVTKQLVSFLHCRTPCGVNGVPWECLNGDVRNLSDLESPYLRTQNIDSIITSPPYATALPYLDTNRLSLAFLRLANKQRRRQLDSEMIGNREIGLKTRTELEQEFLGDYEHNPLPPEVKECIKKVYELNVHSEVGFRRKNMAALLYKYFMDMYHSMIKMRQVLKPGASIAIIIGNNLTKAGGEEVVIQTDRFLRLIGQSIGMRFMEEIPISVTTEDLAHVKHAIRENKIILLTKE